MIRNLFIVLYSLIIVFRILSLYLIINFPLLGWVLIFLVDTEDYFFALRTGLTFRQYQFIDKMLDMLNMLYLVIGAYFIGLAYPLFYLLLFGLRLVGELLYWRTKEDKYLFVFPNVIEFLFPLQILLNWNITIIFMVALVAKLGHEYLVHIYHWIDPISLKYIREHPEHQRRIMVSR